ncbi:unnamed protein product [Enterobius vermicularis]|uniref:Glucuronosyltransferase n=1 Tax=Enterobius vermicularis TaxID=51028 RepID=A0A0N4VEV5_ENTVE|nr:unnamed protein product [Enterobius vermicularis]
MSVMSVFIHEVVNSCEGLLQNKKFFKRLMDARFDLALANAIGFCTVGIVYAAKFPTWIWMNNGPLIDYVANAVGVPSISSYIPCANSSSHLFQR